MDLAGIFVSSVGHGHGHSLRDLAIHALAALITRQPLSAGLIATAELGVPAAVVQIGLQEHVITPALGAAVTIAALGTLGLAALGTDLLARRGSPPAPPQAQRSPSPPHGEAEVKRHRDSISVNTIPPETS